MSNNSRIIEIIQRTKLLALEYYDLTGKPLGITGEVAEVEAARILELDLADARQAGYDATRVIDGVEEKIQIKGRRILGNSKPGQRVGKIRLDHEWDYVMLVLLDEFFSVTEIYEADRVAVETALLKPGSKARNERGALSVSKFKSIGRRTWRA